jgi:hypothetical protein
MQHFWDTIPGLAIGAVSLVLGMLMGAAYSPVVSEHRSGQYKVKLADALQTACLETDWRVLAKLRSFFGPRRRTPDADDPKNAIVLGGVASVMAVALYVPRAYVIANVLILASIAIAAGTAFVFVVLYKRDVVNGGGLVRSVLFSYLLTAVGVLCGIWLIHPRTGSTALSQLAGSLNQGRGLFENGFDSFFFVLYQLIGAIAIACPGRGRGQASGFDYWYLRPLSVSWIACVEVPFLGNKLFHSQMDVGTDDYFCGSSFGDDWRRSLYGDRPASTGRLRNRTKPGGSISTLMPIRQKQIGGILLHSFARRRIWFCGCPDGAESLPRVGPGPDPPATDAVCGSGRNGPCSGTFHSLLTVTSPPPLLPSRGAGSTTPAEPVHSSRRISWRDAVRSPVHRGDQLGHARI